MFLVCCHYLGIHIARSLHTKWPLTFWAVDNENTFWFLDDIWQSWSKYTTTALCSGEWSIQERSLSSCLLPSSSLLLLLYCSAMHYAHAVSVLVIFCLIFQNKNRTWFPTNLHCVWRVGLGSWYNTRMETTTTYSWCLLEEHPPCGLYRELTLATPYTYVFSSLIEIILRIPTS